jgi:AbrB family looped-hinge helix DNA binding protein
MPECLIIGHKLMADAARVGKRGTVVIPARLRKKFGIEEGSSVLVEDGAIGVVIRPAVTVPVEVWTRERKAAFLLENAVDRKDYAWARREVRRMGLDPDKIPHGRPKA